MNTIIELASGNGHIIEAGIVVATAAIFATVIALTLKETR